MPDDTGTPKEQSQYRGLCGTLAWPAAQTAAHGAATVYIVQAAGGKATVRDMLDLNKSLRFMKENADIPMRFLRICEWCDLRLGSYFDGSWASRPDMTSQIGALLCDCSDYAIETGQPTPLVIMDYGSKKAPRVSRSSLFVEGQGASTSADSLEWCKIFLALCLHPLMAPDDPGAA